MSVLRRSLILFGMLIFTVGVMAQTVADAGSLYNEGNTFYKDKDYASAISSYESALKTADAVGGDAIDLKLKIEAQLAKAYYANAGVNYKAKKYNNAIDGYKKTADFASSIGDDDLAKKSTKNIAKVRTSKGADLLKDNKLDEALAEFGKSLEIYPTYYKTYYYQMLTYKSKDDMAKMMESADNAIKYAGDNSKAQKTVKKVKSTASKALVNAGAKEIQREHPSEAIAYLNDSFKYSNTSCMPHYYLALAYSKEKKYEDAISSAQKALSIESDKDKSDVYFALGLAYEGKGDSANACSAYQKVTTGPNVEAAKYQMTQVLKCS